jgi:hypothetical protein
MKRQVRGSYHLLLALPARPRLDRFTPKSVQDSAIVLGSRQR